MVRHKPGKPGSIEREVYLAEQRGSRRNNARLGQEEQSNDCILPTVETDTVSAATLPIEQSSVSRTFQNWPEHASRFMMVLTQGDPPALMRCDSVYLTETDKELSNIFGAGDITLCQPVCPITLVTNYSRSRGVTVSESQGYIFKVGDASNTDIIVTAMRFKSVSNPSELLVTVLKWCPVKDCYVSLYKRISDSDWFEGRPVRIVPLPDGEQSRISAGFLDMMFTDLMSSHRDADGDDQSFKEILAKNLPGLGRTLSELIKDIVAGFSPLGSLAGADPASSSTLD